ncbi:2-hydroxy-acid oxidase [Saccharothrix deserti]|uniref:2-hydroxy-acid oxidase n=1 Tax=Saccharothrix deserti TaxID=2593674 RepID=UPI00131E656C|nr:2-hydroxy-acid oxidase [Saccharothrix deserti]
MRLIRAERRTFTGAAGILDDDDHRADVAAYFADMTRPFGAELDTELSGHSYGEMAKALVAAVVPAAEPVDLLVLAFSIHDMWPGRATATYLSHLCPGTPLSFAVCDQGSAAPFTGLRVIRDYGARRALLIVVEQASLPYDSTTAPPLEHRGVAMLYSGHPGTRVTDLRQYPDVAPEAVAGLASLGVAELSAGHPGARVVLSDSLAAVWPGPPDHTRAPVGQPTTGVWWHLAEALAGSGGPVVIGDYDRELRYLCFAVVEVRDQ